jgi:hypothetical protein
MTAEDTMCETCHEQEGEMVCESSACGQLICTRCWRVSDYGRSFEATVDAWQAFAGWPILCPVCSAKYEVCS